VVVTAWCHSAGSIEDAAAGLAAVRAAEVVEWAPRWRAQGMGGQEVQQAALTHIRTGRRCEHNRERYVCKDCGGGGICEHGRHRRICKCVGIKSCLVLVCV
jgi:hypothetical protein